jgi:alkenylglycerophosphocholine/alkenylglycerophosphoethanolamine hydrolase
VTDPQQTGSTRSRLLPFIPFAVIGVAHLITLLTPTQAWSTQTKWALIPALLIAFVVTLRPRRGEALAYGIVALVFSLLGDILIASVGSMGFLLGLGAFFVAHIAYLVLFLRPLRQKRVPWFAVVFAIWLAVLLAVLGPSVGGLLVPVAAYGLVVALSSAAALGVSRVTAIGAVLFLLSDTLLAFKMFLGWLFYPIDFLVMILYIVGQGLIIFGVVSLGSTRRSPRVS